MYRKTARRASSLVCQSLRINSSNSRVEKKLSATALSYQSPLPLMLATIPCAASAARYAAALYWVDSIGHRNTPSARWAMTKTGKRKSSCCTRAPLRSPGRPPVLHRAARRPFWAAIAAGLSSEDAARVAGVSPPVGARWFRKCGGMPPSQLGANAPAPSGRYLSISAREELALLRAQGLGVGASARPQGRPPATI